MKKLSKIFSVLVLLVVVLASCGNPSPAGIAPFVYLAEPEYTDYRFIEYYPSEAIKAYEKKRTAGMQYLNSYYDGQKWYVSLSHTFFVYDTLTKQVKELEGYNSNAIKKQNGEVWVATDNGLRPGRYSSSLCKINEAVEMECLYDINNQQVLDFYIDFERQVFYASGPGVPEDDGPGTELKVVQYNMVTGEEKNIKNNKEHIMTGRLAHICPGQFIGIYGDIHRETGEKIGHLTGSKGQKIYNPINDIVANETAFVDDPNKLIEVFSCEDGRVTHRRTIQLNYEPNSYPGNHAWETTDEGEITLPINEEDDSFSFIGFQSINLRTGEVQVHLFDEPITNLHAVARFV